MCFLVDGLPYSVQIGGSHIDINTDYRAGISFQQILLDNTISDNQKLRAALDIYYQDAIIPKALEAEAVDKLIWFYRCGKDKTTEDAGDGTVESSEPSFSYEHDAGYIYSAFLQAYGIDLTSNRKIHWWQFRALLESLPEDTMLVKIIGYRTAKVPEKASQETRQRIERLKKIYALPKDADQIQLDTDLDAILMSGGNPLDVLKGKELGYGIRRDIKV